MEYREFDISKESNAESIYHILHIKILAVLKHHPMDVYEISRLLNEKTIYRVSGQLQFLKKKHKVIHKKINGIHYWGIPQMSR